MFSVLLTSIEQGLIFAILAMGVYITYKILDFPDLSVEGSFPAGAFIFAKMVLLGVPPIGSILIAGLFGSLIGFLTATLFIRLRIKPLLSGILTLTIMYSVNLRINGKSNVPLFDTPSIFGKNVTLNILTVLAIVLIIKAILDIFFKTEVGYLLLATGDNEGLVRSLGQNSNKYKTIGLMISNGLVAISGALMAQNMNVADINMGASIIVVALASIIIGDTIMKESSLLKGTTRAIFGAISYKIIGGLAIYAGLAPTDLKAINAFIIVFFIAYNNMQLGKYLKNRRENAQDKSEGQLLTGKKEAVAVEDKKGGHHVKA